MAVILYRYASMKDYDTSASKDFEGVTDKEQISDYAISPMQWALGSGLIVGTNDGSVLPKNHATRAEVAAILMRFCENIAK